MSGLLDTTTVFTVSNATLAGGAAGNSEVVIHDAARGLLFVMGTNGVDALDVDTGALAFSIPKSAITLPAGVSALGTGNSVAVSGNTLAVAFDGSPAGSQGVVAAFTLDAAGTAATFRAATTVGVVPDMITFTPDGTKLLVAVEAEPTAGYATDAPGGLAIVDVASWTSRFFGFEAFDAQRAALEALGVKIANGFGAADTALPSTDFEPEYITVSGTRAYVTLQEANSIAVFDLAAEAWVSVIPLGAVNHALPGNGIDTSDRDGGPNIRQVPIQGLHMPDAVASFVQGGVTYLVTANEGDAREYGGAFDEMVTIASLVPATGSAATAGNPALDPALLAQVQGRRGDADLGRLQVTKWAGDTDGDGDLDVLNVIGTRSLSIWQVGGREAAPTLTRVYDSGQLIDQVIASQFPALYDDARSDNKGSEPEHVTLGEVDGVLHAFVGLERANANIAFRIEGPTQVTYAGIIRVPGDAAPETSAFIPGPTPGLAIANEVSGTTSVVDIAAGGTGTYRLQILHASDFEAGLLATGRADRFAAIVDKLEDALPNSITLSGGDNVIPGPFGAAGTDAALVPVLRAYYEQSLGLAAGTLSSLAGASSPFFAADIAILNAIGIQASVLGNHDFDLGPNPLAAFTDFTANTTGATPGARVTNIGAQFPYLSANLSFAGESSLNPLFTTTLREASTYATRASDLSSNNAVAAEAADAQIAPWTTIVENGQTIGVLGLTTQVLASISTTGGVRVLDPAGDGGRDNMAELAQILQPWVDQMQAQGINKIVLLSHLQQYANELALAPLLRGVDVIVSAGSHTVFADGGDALRPGDAAAEGYPVFRTGADGNPVAIVSTAGEYSYVGRLVLDFDANGVITGAPDAALNGPVATTDANVAALWGADDAYADGTRGGEVRQVTTAIQSVIAAKDGNVLGFTDVFLEGRRNEVRSEETNLGNLTADANLFVAKQVDPGVMLSFKNGGGIRAEIGAVLGQPVPAELPPLANPAAGKPGGAVSQLDIENSLRFNNNLSIISVSAANLERIFEHAVAGWTPTATPGQFAQVGGASFSFDPTKAAQVVNAGTGAVTTEGQRIQSLVLLNEDGSIADTIVSGGVLQGDGSRVIRMVTLDFLAGGGDGYPLAAYTIAGSRVNLLNDAALGDGAATFAAKGTEQDALAEFLEARHGTDALAFQAADAAPAGDLRIQNLALRADTTAQAYVQVTPDGAAARLSQLDALGRFFSNGADARVQGLDGAEGLFGGAGRDHLLGRGGDDVQTGGNGADTLDGGAGADLLLGEAGNDTSIGGEGEDLLFDGDGDDLLQGGAGDDVLVSGAGDDVLEGGDGADLLLGEAGEDSLAGGDGDDRLFDGEGRSRMDGGAGNDVLAAGAGADTLDGGAGEDLLLAGAGNDVNRGGAGADRIFDDGGDDTLLGEGGDDVLVAGGGADTLDGGEGNDLLQGGAGDDLNIGGAGDDHIFEEAGNDILRGGDGLDVLFANTGADTLEGGAGDDRLHGEDGDDLLDGGAGNDQLLGGLGADVFRFAASASVDQDWVGDFSAAEGDTLDLSAFAGTFAFGAAPGAMTLINYAGASADWLVGYVDADAQHDFVLIVEHGGAGLSATDFIL